MGTFGKTTASSSFADITADFEVISKFTLGSAQSISKLTIYLDGNGPGAGASQVLKGIIYGDSGGVPAAWRGTTQESTVLDNAAATWVDFPFSSPVSLAAADYWLGYWSGASSNVARYGSDSPATNNSTFKANSYASAVLDPFGTEDGTDSIQIDVYATWSDDTTNPILRLGRWSAW